jgi:hypothetical protein
MSDSAFMPTTKGELSRIFGLLGKPPVLSSENEEQFGETFYQVAECVRPENMVEMIYLWHFVCASWTIKRYIRHGTVTVERFAQQTRDFRAQRSKLREERRSVKTSREVNKLTEGPPDMAQLVQLERNFEEMHTDTDAIFVTADLERDHNRALAQSILFQEQLNALIVSQTRIRDEALRQLELYRKGLGKLVNDATEAALKELPDDEGLVQAADAPSIVPTDEEDGTAVAPTHETPVTGGA